MTPERIAKAIDAVGLYLVVLTLAACTPSVSLAPRILSSQLKVQKISDLPRTDGWQKLQFINEQEGWLADSRSLWRTTNGGTRWEPIYSITADEQQIKSFHFLNSKMGWMQSLNRLYMSEDGGRTWAQLSTPLDFPRGDLQAVSFMTDGKVGWVAGGVYRQISRKELLQGGYPNNAVATIANNSYAVLEGSIFRTDDGGVTWRQQFRTPEVYRFLSLYFTNGEHGLALGDTEVLYTEDDGEQWQAVDFKASCVDQKFMETFEGHPTDAYFANSNVGWLSYSDGYMARSTDGGRTWCDLRYPEDARSNRDKFFQKLHFTNLTRGWGLSSDGFLYETKDAGATWTRVDVNVRFEDIHFLNADEGWAIAKEGLFRIAP